MIREFARISVAAVVLLLLAPTAAAAGTGTSRPLVWNGIPCAQATVAIVELIEHQYHPGGALRLAGNITPCRPAANGEWFALGFYRHWRVGDPLGEATVEYRTFYDPADAAGPPARTDFTITPGFDTSAYDSFGICVVTAFDTRLACFRVDDPDRLARGDLRVSRIPVHDPLVARRLADRVPITSTDPDPICGTCW